MSKISFSSLFDNTESVLANREKTDAEFNFVESNTPVLPATTISKPEPNKGEMAYSISGGKGVADYSGPTLVVNGNFQRNGEWSSEPWTEDERNEFVAKHESRSRQSGENDRKVQKAYRQRLALRKQFTGR